MADLKISQLTGATTPLAGTEVLPIVQGGATKQVSVANLTAGRVTALGNNSTVGTSSVFPFITANGARVGNDANSPTRVTVGNQDTGASAVSGIGFESAGGGWQLDVPPDVTTFVNPLIGKFNGTEKFRFTADGNYVPGTAAKGVNFTANTPAAGMTSQLLNWYEEGTWTPVLTPSTSGSITLTSPTNSMRYTRVGRLVTLTGLIDVASVSSPVGDLRLTGIPFNIGGSGAGSVSVYGLGTTSTATAYQVLVDSGSATTVFIRGYDAGSQVATVANNVQGGSGFYLTIQYTV
jgi:hypothetical protein